MKFLKFGNPIPRGMFLISCLVEFPLAKDHKTASFEDNEESTLSFTRDGMPITVS